MSRMRPEYLDADTPDRAVAADVLVREEPVEEEDDEEGDGEEKEGEEEDHEGYSERPPSDPVVRLSFLPREHRHNKSRQAQTLERGASRSPAVIRHNDQFKCGDIREFNLVFLDFAYRVRGG